MLLYIEVNIVEVAQLLIKRIKCAATRPYELTSVSKAHQSRVILQGKTFRAGDLKESHPVINQNMMSRSSNCL